MSTKKVENNEKKTVYELGKELFGLHDSGFENLSTSYKKRLKEKLSAKYNTDR